MASMRITFRLDNADEETAQLIAQLIAQLKAHPQKARICNWRKLGSYHWSKLLQVLPKYAKYCDWAKLDGDDWAGLLQLRPEFAEHCDWRKLADRDWDRLLEKSLSSLAIAQGKPVATTRKSANGRKPLVATYHCQRFVGSHIP